MSKVTMPEPFGWLLDCLPGGGLAFQRERPSEMQSLVNSTGAVFTTDQAEAYADARVREALEEAMRHVGGNAMDRRHAHRKIRALIPPLPGPVEP